MEAIIGHHRSVRLLAAVTAAILAAGIVSAQQRPQLRSTIEVTVVTATVRDANGRLAGGLPKDAFNVFEDGEPVTITTFTNERVPLGIGLLLDISDSMFGRRIKDAEDAAEQFLVHLLPSTDAFFMIAFNHEARVLFGWRTADDGVHDALARLRPTGATAIYDAVKLALPYMDNRPRERAALVLITDGADTASDLTLHDLRPFLVRSDAFVYAIAIDTPEPQPIAQRVNLETLDEITSQSGGHTEVVRDTAALDGAVANIADELNHQYMFGYSSKHPGDGKYHSIRVKMTDPTLKVRARAGYVAAKR
jgi:Ca-activated chloride channel family protein